MTGRDIVSTALRLARQSVHEAAAQTHRKPSDAQIRANNYKHGKFRWHGLVVSIENAKGATRKGVDANGNPWSCVMPAAYGYVLKSVGADSDHIDLYMGNNPLSLTIWVIDQVDAKTGRFDEHKVMAGFNSKEDALDTYRKAFSDGKADDRIGAVTAMKIGQFKRWLMKGDTTQPMGM